MQTAQRRARIKELRDELAALEAEDAEEHLANRDDLRSRCIALIKQDKFFAAVRIYRDETGIGLREARDVCEAMQRGI